MPHKAADIIHGGAEGALENPGESLSILDGPHRLLGTSTCPTDPYSLSDLSPVAAPVLEPVSDVSRWIDASLTDFTPSRF
jgi:hypothetical protein